jgi:hypothetical protein
MLVKFRIYTRQLISTSHRDYLLSLQILISYNGDMRDVPNRINDNRMDPLPPFLEFT